MGDEGGFAPNIVDNEEGLRLLTSAIERAGYTGKVSQQLAVAVSWDGLVAPDSCHVATCKLVWSRMVAIKFVGRHVMSCQRLCVHVHLNSTAALIVDSLLCYTLHTSHI